MEKFSGMSLQILIDSPVIDEIINKYENEGVNFSASKFKVAYLDEKIFTVGFELYFQDSDKKWSKVAKTSGAMNAITWLSKEGRLELKNVKEEVYDVDAPESV